MPMKNETIVHTLSQILLVDPASETPRINNKSKSISKRQLIRRLELLVQEMEELEIEIDLTEYKETIAHLKKIKATHEYNELIQEVVDSYDPDFGVTIERKNELKIVKEMTKKEEIESQEKKKSKRSSV